MEGAATLAAVTVTIRGALIEAGAVYRPELEMEPTAGLIDQETAVLDKPVTAALNCRVPETCAVALAGEMVMTTGWRVMAAEADIDGLRRNNGGRGGIETTSGNGAYSRSDGPRNR